MAMNNGRHDDHPEHFLFLSWRDPWHPESGGAERWLLRVAERLAADGAQVTVLSAHYESAAPEEERNGVRWVRRGGRLSIYLVAALMLAMHRLGRPTAVIEVQNGMPFLARLFTRTRVAVVVHHVHREQWPVVGKVLAKVGWFLESVVAVRVNRGLSYVTVSEFTRSELIKLGVEPSDITIAWNGCDDLPALPAFEIDPEPRLVVLGRLVPHKRVEDAIEVVAALREEWPTLTLRIVGSGWWEQSLRETIDAQGLNDAVSLAGHVSETEKYVELGTSWIHLLPSVKEGWGLSIIEAAQLGVPSIAYADAGGVQDSILDGATGLLAHDRAGFIRATRTLLTDHSQRTELGNKARLRSAEFTWSATTASVRAALATDRWRASR